MEIGERRFNRERRSGKDRRSGVDTRPEGEKGSSVRGGQRLIVDRVWTDARMLQLLRRPTGSQRRNSPSRRGGYCVSRLGILNFATELGLGV